MLTAANDNAPESRLPVPLWRDGAHWFAVFMVIGLGLVGLWRAGAFN